MSVKFGEMSIFSTAGNFYWKRNFLYVLARLWITSYDNLLDIVKANKTFTEQAVKVTCEINLKTLLVYVHGITGAVIVTGNFSA